MDGTSNWNVVSEEQGSHVGRLGWLASKSRPELTEGYRQLASGLRHWNRDLDMLLWRVYEWLSDNPLDMHQFIVELDNGAWKESNRSDFPLCCIWLRLVLFTDASHEWISVTGYCIILQGMNGSSIIIRWRSSTTKLRSTSSTFSEIEALQYGTYDFLPIWQVLCAVFNAHIEAVIYVDSESCLKIVQNGFSKGLLWLTGVDRCIAAESTAAISDDDTHLATTKGRTLRIQLLHELIAHLLRHVGSLRMKADAMTKQLPGPAFAMHLRQSFQLRDRREPLKPRCACMRCESPYVFAKSRCENDALPGKRFCENCSAVPCPTGFSPRMAVGTPNAVPARNNTSLAQNWSGFSSCDCGCRGKTWMALITSVSGCMGDGFQNISEDPKMIYAVKNFNVPISLAKNRTVYNGAIGVELDPYQEWIDMLWVGTVMMLFLLSALVFIIWSCRGPIFLSGGDADMPSALKSEPRGGGGGGDKRGRGDDDPRKPGDITGSEWWKLMNQADRRTPKQRDADIARRSNTQCIFIGWLKADQSHRDLTGEAKQYRRCRSDCNDGYQPWCETHYLRPHDNADENPNRRRNRGPRRRGLGEGLEDYTQYRPGGHSPSD